MYDTELKQLENEKNVLVEYFDKNVLILFMINFMIYFKIENRKRLKENNNREKTPVSLK
jgi:hypothetical protein